MKKKLCLLLTVVLMLSTVAGCGNSGKKADTSKKVELNWVTTWSEQKDSEKVMKEFNKQLKEVLPNTTLKMTYGVDSSKFSLMMAAKQSVDIAWTGYSSDPAAEISNGYYLELNDLIENYGSSIQKEQEKFPEAYESGTVEGSLYLLPNEQPIIHQTAYFQVPTKFTQYFDSDAFLEECHKNYFTTEKVYQILDDYFQKLKSNNLLDATTKFYVQDVFMALATRGYDWIESYRSGAWLCYDAHAKDPKIINFQATDAYKLFIKYAAKWYQENIIPQNILVSDGSAGSDAVIFAEGNVSEMWFKPDEERGVRYLHDSQTNEVTAYKYLTDTYDNMYNGTSIIGSEKTYLAIPFTSENPERAMMLMDLLRSEKGTKLLNLLVYGIEGEHYTLKGNVAYGNGYTDQATPSNLYGVPHWKTGNVFLTYRTPNILDGQIDYAYDYLQNQKPKQFKTALCGFKTNLYSEYTYQINQISQVVSEYQNVLITGSMGSSYEATYKEFMDKLHAAKLDDMLDTVNGLAKDYISKKK